MNRFFSVFVAFVLALGVASPVFADELAASSSVPAVFILVIFLQQRYFSIMQGIRIFVVSASI